MKRISILFIALLLLSFTIPIAASRSNAEVNMNLVETTIPTTNSIETTVIVETTPLSALREPLREDLVYIENLSKEDNLAYRIEIADYIAELFSILADLDFMAYDYLEISEMITNKIVFLQELDNKYLDDYLAIVAAEEEQAKWDARLAEYPVATQVWLYLTDEMGYSDHAAAGIIGNMMAECGGHTLKLQWNLYNSSRHYGLCQWSSKYYPQMQDASLEEQLAFMKESFPDVIDRYGYLYKKGFTYNDFITMDNCGDAAIAFCKIYERPGGNQEYRRGLAQKAYEYFVG